MRFLADENFPREAVATLRRAAHEVLRVRESAPGNTDQEVLKRTRGEGRVLLTFDQDFAALAFRSRLPAECGLVLFRIRRSGPAQLAGLAVKVLASRPEWRGVLAVVEPDRLRLRPLL